MHLNKLQYLSTMVQCRNPFYRWNNVIAIFSKNKNQKPKLLKEMFKGQKDKEKKYDDDDAWYLISATDGLITFSTPFLSLMVVGVHFWQKGPIAKEAQQYEKDGERK